MSALFSMQAMVETPCMKFNGLKVEIPYHTSTYILIHTYIYMYTYVYVYIERHMQSNNHIMYIDTYIYIYIYTKKSKIVLHHHGPAVGILCHMSTYSPAFSWPRSSYPVSYLSICIYIYVRMHTYINTHTDIYIYIHIYLCMVLQ